MDTAIDLRVAEMLCSRLCHDLVSPVGAIKSGLELIAEFGNVPDDEAMGLINSSASQAVARLQFFRIAYGLAGPARAGTTLDDAAEMAAGLITTGRTKLHWPADQRPGNPRISAGGLKILLNMLLLGAEALPRGGDLRVALTPGPGHLLANVSAVGDGAGFSDALLAALTGQTSVEELTPRTVQGYFTALVGQRLAAPVGLNTAAAPILTCKLPANS